MDTKLKYCEIIKQVLQSHAKYRSDLPDAYKSQILFDDAQGQYLVLDIGWDGDTYLHNTPIHLSLIDSKIWVQYDDTEDGIVTDLVNAGVAKSDIVLGFRHPKVRQYTGFAVA